jgi:hypothetical protein
MASIGTIMSSLQDIINTIFSYAASDLLVKPSVKEESLNPCVTGTVMDDLSSFPVRKMLRHLSCSKIVSNICIPWNMSRNCKNMFMLENYLLQVPLVYHFLI